MSCMRRNQRDRTQFSNLCLMRDVAIGTTYTPPAVRRRLHRVRFVVAVLDTPYDTAGPEPHVTINSSFARRSDNSTAFKSLEQPY